MGGGIFANPDARHPFASEGRTYSKGILLEGKHGFGPKSSRTKLTEKTKLENLGRGFCCLGKKLSFRQEKNCCLGKKNCCLGKNSGPSEAGRSYERELSPPYVLRQLEGETPSRALKIRVKWLGEMKPVVSAISEMFCPGCRSITVEDSRKRSYKRRIPPKR